MLNPPSLTDFKEFKSFHLFYYSHKENKVHFLMVNQQSNVYSHIAGTLDKLDPGILFSVGRRVIDISLGLLVKTNLEYFKEGSMYHTVQRDVAALQALLANTLMNSNIYQQFIEDTFETMHIYQDHSDAAYYFVEIPYIETQKFNQFCNEQKIDLQVAYFASEDVCAFNTDNISRETMSLLTSSLKEFIQKKIERIEIVAKPAAKYAVISIYTTPTNYHTMGILGSCFKKHGEQWKFYRFPVERPTEEELSTLDGIYIPGASVCAADKSLPWRQDLLTIIKQAYCRNANCRILGTCFGIQIIAEAFEGKSSRMEQCVRGSSKLEISPDFWELPYVKELNLEPKKTLLLSKSHFDEVVQPPSFAKVYASSESNGVEIMAFEDRCLAFQGHPEINEAWTACLIYQATKEKMNFNLYYEEIKKRYFSEGLEHVMWLKIIYNFLKKTKSESSTKGSTS